ncbi:MAG TPA: BMP family ABC transporter substrate-binding protein [Nitrososphaerales archaeon]|nr:BMP family ABC transporter substrate-binding protein [Nitrososphaerales archaeon]
MKGTKRYGITALVGALIVIVVILIGVAAYAFAYPPTSVTTSTVTSTATTTVSGTGTAVSTVTATTTVTTATAAQASALSKLKVGFILPLTPADDSWNYNAYNAMQKLESEYNFTLSTSENIASGTDAAVPAGTWAGEGYNIVVFMGGQYQQEANTFAGQNPTIMSVCVDCTVANYSNVYRIWLDLSGGGFVLGAMAGMISKTHSFGLVGGGDIPSIWEGHEGFIAGVMYTSPVTPSITNTFEAFAWADVSGAENSAKSDYTAGADVVFSSGDGIDVGVLGAAMAQPTSPQVWATNVYTNLTAIEPADNRILLGSMVIDYASPFFKAMLDYVNNNWHWGYTKVDMPSGLLRVQPGPDVPSNIAAAGLALQSDIVEGQIQITFASTSGGSPYCFVNPSASSCADMTLTVPSGGGAPTGNMAAQFNYLPPVSSLP